MLTKQESEALNKEREPRRAERRKKHGEPDYWVERSWSPELPCDEVGCDVKANDQDFLMFLDDDAQIPAGSELRLIPVGDVSELEE
jgi:hypothetical protein